METISSVQLILYLGNPEVPRKDSQCELRLAFRYLLPPVQSSFYPSKMQTKKRPSCSGSDASDHITDHPNNVITLGSTSREKLEKNMHFFQICIERLLPFVPPELCIMVWEQTCFGVLDKSHDLVPEVLSGSPFWIFTEEKGDLQLSYPGGRYLISQHPHRECWSLPSAAHLGNETSFLEKPWRWKG